MNNYPPLPYEGYELIAFFGINCHKCLGPDEGKTPEEAASRKANQYTWVFPDSEKEDMAPISLAYVHRTEEGFFVFVTHDIQYTPLFCKSMRKWLQTPIETHIERWEKGEKFN